MASPRGTRARACELAGWYLFIASAVFFVLAGVQARDLVAIVASLLFLGACVVFLIPYYTPEPESEKESK